jgi:eukaryotic-like serine/threonine-protein kinase
MTEMSPAEAIYFAALEKKLGERVAYLDEACAGQPELRARVERLLAAQPQVGQFLEPPAGPMTADDPATTPPRAVDPSTSAVEHPGACVGLYKLLQLIGEGGMGTVWMAEQFEPVRRTVALKVVKAGMDTRQVVARFEAERQALALMDHPNIARVFDGGVFNGRPYFVMELVKGTPITKYCDEHRLTIAQRLELFVAVCQALQHAHQKGIIHRDVKPSNVLVAPYDDRPVVKVIDFGIAKATGPKLTEKTMFTEFGAVVGTLQYMSPEQATTNNLDIDTRSDIYSLGVLLYEMLTGTTPLDANRLRGDAMVAMLMAIQDEEPPSPSTRVSDSKDSLPSIAAQRHVEPAKLSKLIRGDLDWITMKALEKDRTRRYETANSLAMDIQRYLTSEDVLAAPPSAAYRFKKFLRRNKGPVIAASLLFLALVAGVVGTSWGMWRAKQSAEAERLAKQDAVTANEQTQKRLAQIEKGVELFAGMLTGINPRNEKIDGPTIYQQLRERTEKAADQLDSESVGDPLAVARLQSILGETLRELGNYSQSIAVLEKARATRAKLLSADHPDTLMTMSSLATGYQFAGQFDKALPLLEETLRLRKSKLGAGHADTLESMNNLASGYESSGQLNKALPLYEEVLQLTKDKKGANHADTLTTMNNLAKSFSSTGQLEKALPLHEETLRIRKSILGADHVDTLKSMNDLAMTYDSMGQRDKALQQWEETLRLTKKKLGADHPDTRGSVNNLATAYQADGQLDKALPLLEDNLRYCKSKLGDDHPNTLTSMNNLALGYLEVGQTAKALPLLEESVRLSKAKLGADHPDTLKSMNNLAACYGNLGQLDNARLLFDEILNLTRAKHGFEESDTLKSMNNLAVTFWQAKQLDKSIPLFEETLKRRQSKLGRDHPDTLETLANLGVNYKDAGRFEEAFPMLEEAFRASTKHKKLSWVSAQLLFGYLEAGQPERAAALVKVVLPEARKAIPKESALLAQQLATFGMILLQAKAFTEAEPLLRESLAIREVKEPDDWRTFNTKSMLGGALLGQEKHAEAEPLLIKGYEGMKQREKSIPKEGTTRIPEAIDRLIELYTATNNPDELKKLQAERAKYPAREKETRK